MSNPRILHLIPYMHPAAGGPPVVVDRWTVELQKLGVDSQVLTTNAYSVPGDEEWLARYRDRYPITVVVNRGPAGFGYGVGLKKEFCQRLEQLDLVHVHNLWSYSNQLAAKYCPRYGVPFVVSTHGMLDPHSVSRKRWKKECYGRLLEWPALRRSRGLLFTHEEEERLARESASDLPPGHVVALGTDPPPSEDLDQLGDAFLEDFPNLRGCELILFLGRLHSKKGLDLLLPAFAEVARHRPQSRLVLVGPGETNYVESIKRSLGELSIFDRCCLTGQLNGARKWGALAAADVFVLPSYQENFAISVVESLRAGTPVLLSKRVNIWSDLVGAGAAQVAELDVDSLAKQLESMLHDLPSLQIMGERGMQLAIEKYSWQSSGRRLLDVYQSILDE